MAIRGGMMTVEQVRPSETDLGLLPVGAALRNKREQLGWSLADVAAWLRIKLYYLEALEGGQVAKLPGNAYALGFLRAYSGALGLDAEDMSRRFRQETKEVSRKPELSFPAPVPERGVPAGALVLLGVVVVVAAYAGWFEFSGHERRSVQAVPPVPAALARYAGPIGAPVPSPQVAAVMPGPGQTPSPLPAGGAGTRMSGAGPMVAPVAGPVGTSSPDVGRSPVLPSVAAAARIVPTVPATPTRRPAGPSIPAADAGAPETAPTPVPGQITIESVASSWVQVREIGGKVIYDHVLHPGETWTTPAGAGPLTLETGNAGGIRLAVDGTTSPVLGRVGSVRRGVPLNAQAVKDGSIAVVRPISGDADTSIKPAMDQGSPPSIAMHRERPHLNIGPTGDDATERLNERQLDGAAPR